MINPNTTIRPDYSGLIFLLDKKYVYVYNDN